jgi:hypothetical protein
LSEPQRGAHSREVYRALQRQARKEGRGTQELFEFYLLERFLYRPRSACIAEGAGRDGRLPWYGVASSHRHAGHPAHGPASKLEGLRRADRSYRRVARQLRPGSAASIRVCGPHCAWRSRARPMEPIRTCLDLTLLQYAGGPLPFSTEF